MSTFEIDGCFGMTVRDALHPPGKSQHDGTGALLVWRMGASIAARDPAMIRSGNPAFVGASSDLLELTPWTSRRWGCKGAWFPIPGALVL